MTNKRIKKMSDEAVDIAIMRYLRTQPEGAAQTTILAVGIDFGNVTTMELVRSIQRLYGRRQITKRGPTGWDSEWYLISSSQIPPPETNLEDREWKEFFPIWRDAFDDDVSLSELLNLAQIHSALVVIRGKGEDRSQLLRMGRSIKRQLGRGVGRFGSGLGIRYELG